jgi:hypothetical protein
MPPVEVADLKQKIEDAKNNLAFNVAVYAFKVKLTFDTLVKKWMR